MLKIIVITMRSVPTTMIDEVTTVYADQDLREMDLCAKWNKLQVQKLMDRQS